MFGLMTAVAFLALFLALRLTLTGIKEYPPERIFPMRGWEDVDGKALVQNSNTASGTWSWATIQWLLNDGDWISLAGSPSV